MLISIAIPCYRSAKTLPNVIEEIQEVFAKQDKYEYEVILVNDGSPDNTFEVIQAICASNDRITRGEPVAKFRTEQCKNGGNSVCSW